VNRVKIIISLLLILSLAFTVLTSGCSSPKTENKSDSASPTKQASSEKSQSASVSTTTPSKQTTPAKPKPAPALSQVNFSLSLQPPQEYTEYTQPIYLKSENTLHLVWTVTGVGDHLYLAFNTPNGKYIGVKADGNMVDLSPSRAAERLPRVGSFILKPSLQSFGDGYYIFHAHITGKDQAINVKLLYWTEE
jgi:uncharacterized protein YceK